MIYDYSLTPTAIRLQSSMNQRSRQTWIKRRLSLDIVLRMKTVVYLDGYETVGIGVREGAVKL